MPQYATLSHAECNAIHILREMASDETRKAVKREIFSRAKVAFSIPPEHKLVVETDVQNTNAGLLKNKTTRESYELNADGKWVGAANGANSAQRWFKVPVDNLHELARDGLDNMEAADERIVSQPNQPNGRVASPHHEHVVFGEDGNLWIQLDADAYGFIQSHEEEDDEHPY